MEINDELISGLKNSEIRHKLLAKYITAKQYKHVEMIIHEAKHLFDDCDNFLITYYYSEKEDYENINLFIQKIDAEEYPLVKIIYLKVYLQRRDWDNLKDFIDNHELEDFERKFILEWVLATLDAEDFPLWVYGCVPIRNIHLIVKRLKYVNKLDLAKKILLCGYQHNNFWCILFYWTGYISL